MGGSSRDVREGSEERLGHRPPQFNAKSPGSDAEYGAGKQQGALLSGHADGAGRKTELPGVREGNLHRAARPDIYSHQQRRRGLQRHRFPDLIQVKRPGHFGKRQIAVLQPLDKRPVPGHPCDQRSGGNAPCAQAVRDENERAEVTEGQHHRLPGHPRRLQGTEARDLETLPPSGTAQSIRKKGGYPVEMMAKALGPRPGMTPGIRTQALRPLPVPLQARRRKQRPQRCPGKQDPAKCRHRQPLIQEPDGVKHAEADCLFDYSGRHRVMIVKPQARSTELLLTHWANNVGGHRLFPGLGMLLGIIEVDPSGGGVDWGLENLVPPGGGGDWGLENLVPPGVVTGSR